MNLNLKDRSVAVLIAVNLFPLLGVLFFDWDAVMIVMFYCIETFITGVFNVGKMIRSEAEIPEEHLKGKTSQISQQADIGNNTGCIKAVMVPFFIVHYNVFVIIQTVVIVLLSDQFSENEYKLQNFFHNNISRANRFFTFVGRIKINI